MVIANGLLYADEPCWWHTECLWDKVCPRSFLAAHSVLMATADGISVLMVIIGST